MAADAPRRGGPQQIPRPPVVAGAPAPWADLTPAERRFGLGDLRAAFDRLGPAVPSPLEGLAPRAAAVLAALYEDDDTGDLHVVLTRRSSELRVHRGEVSFPGGRQEPDEPLWDTARREAWEEVALDPALPEWIGELDHLSTISSDSFIVPFVAALPGRPDLTANPGEVDVVLHVPVSELLDHMWEERWDIFGTLRPIVFFDLIGDTVWGATAAMLRQLLGFGTGTLTRGSLGHD